MSTQYFFVQAVDSLSLRGNKLFGDSGAYGQSHFPPAPSVLAGAFRSLLWRDNGEDADAILSSDFAISLVSPARQQDQHANAFFPMPSDVFISNKGDNISTLRPHARPALTQSSYPQGLAYLPLLCHPEQAKPESDWLLTEKGLKAYLMGNALSRKHLTKQSELWTAQDHTQVALSHDTRAAAESQLFSVQHTIAKHDYKGHRFSGLIVGVQGSHTLPTQGYLRLGGDGHAAEFRKLSDESVAGKHGLDQILQSAPLSHTTSLGFKLVLQSPACFQQGWLPDQVTERNGEYWLSLAGFEARLCCASVSRNEVISGWDLRQKRPKPAEKVTSAGSVYWFDKLSGEPEALHRLAASGWWPDPNTPHLHRKAEGYNRVLLAAWTPPTTQGHA